MGAEPEGSDRSRRLEGAPAADRGRAGGTDRSLGWSEAAFARLRALVGTLPRRFADPVRPRIFQIGFNRCGTDSICVFFRRNGYRAAHWRKGRLAEGMELARLEDRPLLTHVADFDVYTDMERVTLRRRRRGPVVRRLLDRLGAERLETPIYAFKHFRLLDRQYPGSRFILNVRDVDNWIASRLRFEAADGGAYRFCVHGERAHESEAALADCWRREWHEHVGDVRSWFAGRPDDLLVFDVEADPPEKMARFFGRAGHELDPRLWPWKNRTRPG